jgi:hypothetical protein
VLKSQRKVDKFVFRVDAPPSCQGFAVCCSIRAHLAAAGGILCHNGKVHGQFRMNFDRAVTGKKVGRLSDKGSTTK